MARTNLNFHLTFRPERQYLSGLLSELSGCNGCDVEEISSLTGIPTGKSSGKVEPSICYLEYMGLITKRKINGRYDLDYTPLGNCVNSEDSGLLEKLTLLIMHCMVVRPYYGAELWGHVFHNIFPKYRNHLTQKQFEKELEIQFGPGVKSAPFWGSYQELFSSLNLISVESGQIDLHPSKIMADYVYLYAAVLFSYWDEWLDNAPADETNLASTSEIAATHLKALGFRNPFGWSEKEEYQALEIMASKGLIALNRQMIPFTIRRIAEKDAVIEQLYSELC